MAAAMAAKKKEGGGVQKKERKKESLSAPVAKPVGGKISATMRIG